MAAKSGVSVRCRLAICNWHADCSFQSAASAPQPLSEMERLMAVGRPSLLPTLLGRWPRAERTRAFGPAATGGPTPCPGSAADVGPELLEYLACRYEVRGLEFAA